MKPNVRASLIIRGFRHFNTRHRRETLSNGGLRGTGPGAGAVRHLPYNGPAAFETPRMPPTHATLAILFVDVSGSTRLYETIGDEQALARVGRALAMIARVSEDCGGRVVKTMGDGAMCVFETADAAMRASRLMLEKNDEQQDPGEPGLGMHVGCHFGPVLESAGDVFGDTVNLAARVSGLAKVGQIITTADTAAKLSPELAARARKLHAMPVKGKQQAIMICELL